MAVRLFSATLVCFTTLYFCGLNDAHPQTTLTLSTKKQITESCLGCICEAISSCDLNQTCSGDVCGPFRITWAYWSDSGSPVLQGESPQDQLAYPRCTNDPTCAKKATINYLTRFAQDCNGDGIIDCLDYASIHKLGGYGCSGPLDNEYKTKFSSCFNKNNLPNNGQAYVLPSVDEKGLQITTTEEIHELDLRIPI
ncbi:EF-Hand 1, calcium-binding site,Destabilase [Cinara cedri]|uniref:lysozyme n=1 Tax=Cinara cedri TaxID=506608 RepID=A0A5E4MN12_9HEMI|nr:EF-Hand 1, calcium-binding site,Destabilase [Cinara cedri]